MKLLHSIRLLGGLALLAPGLAGCDALPGILFPEVTTVRVVNNALFDVEFDLYYGDDENTLEVFLIEFGEHVQTTLQPGESTSIAEDCDDLRAVIIDDADLRVLGSIGPEDRTGVLREGDDFGCRDTITFTFSSDAFGLAFDIGTEVN